MKQPQADKDITAVDVANGILKTSYHRKDHYTWKKETEMKIIKQLYKKPIVEWFDYLHDLCPQKWHKDVYEIILVHVKLLHQKIEEAREDERVKKLMTALFQTGIKELVLIDPKEFSWWWDLVDEGCKKNAFKEEYTKEAPAENVSKMLRSWDPNNLKYDPKQHIRILEKCLKDHDLMDKGREIISILDVFLDRKKGDSYYSYSGAEKTFEEVKAKFVETYGQIR